MSTDRIEKHVMLRAPRSRVWRAITNHEEFGQWFRVKLHEPFVQGKATHGQITHKGYEHLKFKVDVVRIQPEHYFAYYWHPYGIDPNVDYDKETPTLVEFTLEETSDGTSLTIVESGFDRVPLARRAEAFRMNDQGWTQQAKNIEAHVTGS
jgi:uncharacterized protein YndB with AHSA1/START domain